MVRRADEVGDEGGSQVILQAQVVMMDLYSS
jgi:hypothetical protein